MLYSKRTVASNLFGFLHPSQFGLNERLRYLYVYLDPPANFTFKFLNNFRALIHLEIEGLNITGNPQELTLPKLRALSSEHDLLILRTPNLEALQNYSIERVHFDYPANIRRLESNYAGAAVMAKFKNVEVFKCDYIPNASLIRDILTTWPHLKQCEFDLKANAFGNKGKFEQFQSFLVWLLNQRTAFQRRAELKIYLADVLLVDASQLTGLTCKTFGLKRKMFQVKNYKQLRDQRPDVHLRTLIYDEALSPIGEELCSELFVKFPAINEVRAENQIINPKHFEWFLANVSQWRNVLCLTLDNASLDQSFYDRLPNIAGGLTELRIKGASRPVINFDFILRLTELRAFETDRHLKQQFALAAKKFEKSENFCNFRFSMNTNEQVSIRRDQPGKDSFTIDFLKHLCLWASYSRNKLKWAEVEALYEQKRIVLQTVTGYQLLPNGMPIYH